jgi:hypothetical protein
MIFGICRVVVFGFRMSLDECLGREIDNMGEAPKPDVKFNTPSINSNESLTECGGALHQRPYLSSL